MWCPPTRSHRSASSSTLLADADELLLATDEDREGEAIAWHLLEELKPKVPARRMVFHEITPEAIAQAVANPRDLDNGLVDAYQTRRVLDRLYGYEVSPVLWKKVMPRLSAGRVQSVATRLVVARERERIAFRPAAYWDLEAIFAKIADGAGAGTDDVSSFPARLMARGRPPGGAGPRLRPDRGAAQRRPAVPVRPASDADRRRRRRSRPGWSTAGRRRTGGRLDGVPFSVKSVERKPYRRSPYAPFRTTTLQQEASRKLGFSAKYTMSVAQRLYENGHITYMRTDSITLSQTAINAARAQARELYGAEYVPDAPRVYTSKVKNAQEAHEAIRPAGDRFRTPPRTGLSGDELRLYELIWKRTVASQMKDATGESVSVRVSGRSSAGEEAEFGASGKIITFYGFLKAYVEGVEDDAERDDRERRLPPLAEGDPLRGELSPAEHATRPPARYTEATLVKELEDREIGRPSTYASIIGTILDRGYVFKKGTALVPSFLAFAVVNLLERHFAHLVDYDFTARMEDALDEIARGEAARVPWLQRFYFGTDGTRRPRGGPEGAGQRHRGHRRPGRELVPAGRHRHRGPGRPVRALPGAGRPAGERARGHGAGRADPRAGRRAVRPAQRRRPARHRPGVRAPDRREGRPVRALRDRGAARRRQGQAAHVLAARVDVAGHGDAGRRAAAAHAAADHRRAGRRDRHGAERPLRPLRQEGHRQPLAGRARTSCSPLSLAEAKEMFAQPKARGRGRAAAPPLRELGEDPDGRPIVIKDGRFGPYATDGETNASLRKGDDVESITLQRAVELLAERRASGPAKPRRRAAAGSKTGTGRSTARSAGPRRTSASRSPRP